MKYLQFCNWGGILRIYCAAVTNQVDNNAMYLVGMNCELNCVIFPWVRKAAGRLC